MYRSAFALTLLFPFLVAMGQTAAAAQGGVYSSVDQAQQTCPQEEVVWLSLSDMKYYHKDQTSFGKGTGVYACLSTAHAKSYHDAK